MLSTMILSLTLIGQPEVPQGRLDNLAAGAAAAPAKTGSLRPAFAGPNRTRQATTAYYLMTPPNRCLRSVWEIRSDGPLNNPYGVNWVRLSSWSQLNQTQLRAVTEYERNPYRR